MEFSNLTASDKLLISLDEVNFSYLTTYNRTWLPKGRSSYFKNISFKGSRSWIGAIASRGDIFFWWLESTNKSPNFVSFLKELKIWIQLDLNIKMTNTILILYNCLVHKCKKSLEALNEFWATILFLPAYTPVFAAIELLFNWLKKLITWQWRFKVIISSFKGRCEKYKRSSCCCLKERDCKLWEKDNSWNEV